MRNKIIALFLASVMSLNLFASASLQSIASQQTSPGSWTDPLNGTTFVSGGTARYAFTPGIQYDSPWLMTSPPGLKAGCGGVSLTAGFAGFLNLQQIGQELQTAISSVGMGVLVALLQTLPTIGQAFKAIEKIVRKIQQLLANACQLTTNAISNIPAVKNEKKRLQSDISNFLGTKWLTDQQNGAVAKANDIYNFFQGKPTSAKKNAATDTIGKETIHTWVAMLPEEKHAIGQAAILPVEYGVHMSSLSNWFNKGSIAGYNNIPGTSIKTQAISGVNVPNSIQTEIELKMALFGYFYVKQSFINPILNSTTTGAQGAANLSAENFTPQKHIPIGYQLPTQNSIQSILAFFTGSVLGGSTTAPALKYPSNLNVLVYTYPSGPSSKPVPAIFACATKPINSTMSYGTISNNMNLAQDTQATLLHILNPAKYPAPSVAVDDYIPGGYNYLKIIQKYGAPANYPELTGLLAGVNARFALERFISEMTLNAYNIKGKISSAKYKQYMARINKVSELLKQVVGQTTDLKILGMLNNYFNSVKMNGKATILKGTY